jgi:hypothetical protein
MYLHRLTPAEQLAVPERVYLVLLQELAVEIGDVIVSAFVTNFGNGHFIFDQQFCSLLQSQFLYE